MAQKDRSTYGSIKRGLRRELAEFAKGSGGIN